MSVIHYSKKLLFLHTLVFSFIVLTKTSQQESFKNNSNNTFSLQLKDNDSLKLVKAKSYYVKAKTLLEKQQKDSVQFYLDKSITLNDSLTIQQEDFTSKLFELAYSYFNVISDPKNSIIYDTKYLEYFEHYENWDKLNMTYYYSSIGHNYLMLGDYQNALDKAIIPNESLTKQLIAKAKSAAELQDLQVSLLSIYNYELLNNYNLGFAKESNKVIQKIEELLPTISNVSASNKSFIESVFTTIIDLSRGSGNFEKAILFMDYYERLYENPSSLTELRILNQKRKFAFLKNDYSKVVDIHKKAEQIFYTTPNLGYNELHYYRSSLEHYGDVLLKDGFRDYKKAIAINNECISLLSNQKKTAYTNNSYAYSNLAEIYRGLKQYDSALVYFNKAIKESVALRTYRQSAILYQKKASFYINELNDISAGERVTEEALKTMGIESLETLKTIKDTAVNIRSNTIFLGVVIALADEHYSVSNRNSRQESLLLSNDLYFLASEMLSTIKSENKLNGLEIELLNKINNGLLESSFDIQQKVSENFKLHKLLERLEANQNIEMHFRNALNDITLNTSSIPEEVITLKTEIESNNLRLKQKLLDVKTEEDKTVKFNLREQYQSSELRLDSIYKVIDKLSPE
ncbi:tetratricopeptide repeat protein, partial [Psychroserpens sp.]|uniref:tetratricopeptide repeat protein n=1 Tax=Psychroserpens sp. TaxID=2020870 RepID=UPI003C784D61